MPYIRKYFTPLRFGLEFHFEAIFLFGAIYVITAMETVGDCSGVTLGGLNREPTTEEVSGSILADAFGSTFAEGELLDNNFLEWYFADTLIAAGLLAFFLNLVMLKDIEFFFKIY